MKPVTLLYHGTSKTYSAAIEEQGLIPINYDNVYLTADLYVAYSYAKKTDQPVICIIDAPQMAKDGFTFEHDATYAEWTTKIVPAKYIVQVLIESEEDIKKLAYTVTSCHLS